METFILCSVETRTVSNTFLLSRIPQIGFYSNSSPNKELNLVTTLKKEVKMFAQNEVNFLQLIN